MAQPLDFSAMLSDPAFAEEFQRGYAKGEALAQSIKETPVQPEVTAEEIMPQKMSQAEMQQKMYQLMQKSMGGQSEQIEALKQAVAKEQARQEQAGVLGRLDLRPFAQAMRQYGSTTVAVPTEAPEDRTEILRKLQKELTTAKGGLTDDQINFLRTQLANQAAARQAGTEERFLAAKDKDIFKEVKGQFDQINKDYNEFRSNASTIRSALESGDIARLNASIASIARMQGEKGPLAEGDITRNVPATIRNKVEEALYRWQVLGDISYQADPAVLKVIAANIGALEQAAKEKADNRIAQQETLYEGAPMTYERHAKSLADKNRKLLFQQSKKEGQKAERSLQDDLEEIRQLEAKRKSGG